MAVKFIKKTQKTASVAQTSNDALMKDLEGLAHPIVLATAVLDGLKAKVKQATQNLTKVQKPFIAHLDAMDLEPKETLLVNDKESDKALKVSGLTESRTITDNALVYDYLEEIQKGLALKLMTFRLGDLDKYLNPAQLEKVTESSYGGNRRITVVAMGEDDE